MGDTTSNAAVDYLDLDALAEELLSESETIKMISLLLQDLKDEFKTEWEGERRRRTKRESSKHKWREMIQQMIDEVEMDADAISDSNISDHLREFNEVVNAQWQKEREQETSIESEQEQWYRGILELLDDMLMETEDTSSVNEQEPTSRGANRAASAASGDGDSSLAAARADDEGTESAASEIGEDEEMTGTEGQMGTELQQSEEEEDVLEYTPSASIQDFHIPITVLTHEENRKRKATAQLNDARNKKKQRMSLVECPVCLEVLPEMDKVGKVLVVVSCGHIMCSNCAMRMWIQRKNQCFGNFARAASCPKCKQKYDILKIQPVYI